MKVAPLHNQEETSKKHGPGDSSRDLFISQLEVT